MYFNVLSFNTTKEYYLWGYDINGSYISGYYKFNSYLEYIQFAIRLTKFCNVIFNKSFGPNDKIYLGNYAFHYSIININLPENLVSIGDNCFSYSTFPNILVPNSVESVGREAFSFSKYWNISFSELKNLKNYGTNIFKAAALKSFILPNSFKYIPGAMFMNCLCLEYIEIPPITLIDKFAFYNCSKLKNITISEQCNRIHEFAFALSSVERIKLPENLTSIGESCFEKCKNLTYICLKNIFSVGPNLYYIPTRAFYKCENLTYICLKNIFSVGPNAFDSSVSLKVLKIRDGAKYLKENCFRNCTSLISVLIGFDCFVNESAFSECIGIRIVAIKRNCTIKSNAFINCISIKSIILYENVRFDNTPFNISLQNKLSIYYPAKLSEISNEIEKYIQDVTVIDSFDGHNFLSFIPTKISNIAMNEMIFNMIGSFKEKCYYSFYTESDVIESNIKKHNDRFHMYRSSMMAYFIAQNID